MTNAGSQVRGTLTEGNIWLIKIDPSGTNQAQKLTSDGIYRSPLWIPGSENIVAVKENKLILLNNQGDEEKILYRLSAFTLLLGFDKKDSNSILIIQDSKPALLSLSDGLITALPYDKNNKEQRDVFDHLLSSFKDYGQTQIFIEKQSRVDGKGVFRKTNQIHIKSGEQDLVIPCLASCAQPALINGGGQLVFIGS